MSSFYIVLCICIYLPYDFFGNQTTAYPAEKVCAAASLASPSLHGLGSSIVKLVVELSLTYEFVWQALYVNPWVSAAVEENSVLPFPGLHIRLEFNVQWVTYSDV